jgi:hypothetical protein
MKDDSIEYWVRFDFRFGDGSTEQHDYGPINDEAAARSVYEEAIES